MSYAHSHESPSGVQRVQPILLPQQTQTLTHTESNPSPNENLLKSSSHQQSQSNYAASAFTTTNKQIAPPEPRLRDPQSVFLDPSAVGKYLAEEGALARIQQKHRAYVDRDRDSEEEEGALEDAFMRGLGGMAMNEKQSTANQSTNGSVVQPGQKNSNLKLNRKMLGVLSEEFYGCLRATEREMEMDDKKESALILKKRAREERRRQEELAKAAEAANETQFKAGPLTRALHAKQGWKDAAEARKAEFRAQHRRKSSTVTSIQEDNDEAEIEGLSRTALERKRKEDIEAIQDDESTHHRLYLPDCIVPPTITYLKGQAIAWYFSSSVDCSVKRKHSRNLHAEKIIECMNAISYRTPWQSERPIEIVCVFYHSEAHLTPIYMNRERMESFVRQDASIMRPSGVLQKFVPPTTEYNSMIRVTWTPSMCLVERRASGYKLGASRIRLDDRVQTYEVSTGLGVEVREEIVHESSSMRKVINFTCNRIAEHFAIVHGQTIAGQQSRLSMLNSLSHQNRGCTPLKMTLYFKLAGKDPNFSRAAAGSGGAGANNQLYLLLCDEMKWSKLDLDDVELELAKGGGPKKGLGSGSQSNGAGGSGEQTEYDPAEAHTGYAPVVSSHGPGSFLYAGARNSKAFGGSARSDGDSSSSMMEESKDGGNASANRARAALPSSYGPLGTPQTLQQGGHQRSGSQVPLLTDGMDVYQEKRRALAAAHSRSHSTSQHTTGVNASPTREQSSSSTVAAPIPSTGLGRKKKADLRCGHCSQILTILNSNLQIANTLSATAPPAPGTTPIGHSSKPYVDLKSLLMYRLGLCAYLLPPAAVKRYDTPSAIAASQKLYSDFLWNLVKLVLLPYYMTDEKEFKIHLFFQSELDREAERLKQEEETNGPAPVSRLSTIFARTQVASSGYAQQKKEQQPKNSQMSIWEMRIYACKSCASLIRGWKRQREQQDGASASANSAAGTSGTTASGRTKSPSSRSRPRSGGPPTAKKSASNKGEKETPASTSEVLEQLFHLLVESYLEHQRLLPPTQVDLALAPHSTGVPAVLTTLPDTPGGDMYIQGSTGGGFLRSPNPYMVERAAAHKLATEQIRKQILDAAAAAGVSAGDGSPPSSTPPDALTVRQSDTPASNDPFSAWGLASPTSPAAWFARGATPAPMQFDPQPISRTVVGEDALTLDDNSVPPGERVRLALKQDARENGIRPSAIALYEPELQQAQQPKPTKKDRERARLERLAERQARKQRADQARVYEEWLAQQEALKAQEPFLHIRSKLHEPIGESSLETKQAREERRAQRAREAIQAKLTLDAEAEGVLPQEEVDDNKLIEDHESILRKLAALDPVRAEYLRSKTMPDAPSLVPGLKLQKAYNPDINHDKREMTYEQELAEMERLEKQLKTWYKRQVEREVAAFSRGSPAQGSLSGTLREHHARSPSRHFDLNAMGGEISGDDEFASVPEFDARSQAGPSRTFGPVPAEKPNHHRRFGSYLGGKIFVSSGQGMDEREGLGFSGLGLGMNNRDLDASSALSPPPNRVRSAGAARAASPSESNRTPISGASGASGKRRVQSAAPRRDPSASHIGSSSSTGQSSFAATLVAPTRVSSATSNRPRTALQLQRPLSPTSRREIARSALADRGYDNAAAFATRSSPYQRQDEREKELAGFVPAGWDPILKDSFSTTFGRNNSVAGASKQHRALSPKSGKKKSKFGSTYAQRAAAQANVQLTPPDSDRPRSRQGRSLAPSASAPVLPTGGDPTYDPSSHQPPKSLAVFASAGSVGLGRNELAPIQSPQPLHTSDSSTSLYDSSLTHSDFATPLRHASGHGDKRSTSPGKRLSGSTSASNLSRTPSRGGSRRHTGTLQLTTADERDEADQYEIDDAPIFEEGEEAEDMIVKNASVTSAQPTQQKKTHDILTEPSDELIQRAEALLFR